MWSLRYQGDIHYFTRSDDGTPLPYIDVVMLVENPNKSKTYYPVGTYTEDCVQPADVLVTQQRRAGSRGCRSRSHLPAANCKRNVWTIMPNRQQGSGMQGQQARGGSVDASHDREDAGRSTA